jgi:hypothetical protein
MISGLSASFAERARELPDLSTREGQEALALLIDEELDLKRAVDLVVYSCRARRHPHLVRLATILAWEVIALTMASGCIAWWCTGHQARR